MSHQVKRSNRSTIHAFAKRFGVTLVIGAGLFGCAADAQQTDGTDENVGQSSEALSFAPRCNIPQFCPAPGAGTSWLTTPEAAGNQNVANFESALSAIIARRHPEAKATNLTNPERRKYWRGFALSCWGNDWTPQDIADIQSLVAQYKNVSPVKAKSVGCADRDSGERVTNYVIWDPPCVGCSQQYSNYSQVISPVIFPYAPMW